MSPRPKKQRHCCHARRPGTEVFKPVGIPLRELSQVSLAADELEALYLCDLQGLSQQHAGERMGVSRGTIQRLVTEGRRKIVAAISEGQALVLDPSVPISSDE